MAKTASAKKSHRNSLAKRQHNLFWKRRIKAAQKSATTNPEAYETYQSLVDKAAKNKVIHKNKASRLKSRLAKKLNKKSTK